MTSSKYETEVGARDAVVIAIIVIVVDKFWPFMLLMCLMHLFSQIY